MQRVPLTPNGYKKLQEELERLLKVDRPKNIQAIAEARAHGDLSENAEYHAAKEQQSFIVGRIQELKAKMKKAGYTEEAECVRALREIELIIAKLDRAIAEEKKE